MSADHDRKSVGGTLGTVGLAWAAAVALIVGVTDGGSYAAAPERPSRPSLVSYSSSVLSDGPSLFYRFSEPNGNVSADSSGTGNDLTGGSIRGLPGALATDTDFAAYTGGCVCYMTSQTSAGLPTGNSARTVEAWVRSTVGAPFSSWGAGTDGFGVDLSGMRTFRVTGGSQSHTFTADHDLADDQWHHFVASYDGATVRGYVDGELVGSAAFSQSLATTATNLTVGWRGPAVDELAIYPTALSASQVAAHFAASGNTRPGAPGTPSTVVAANKVTVSWQAATAGVPAGAAQVTRYVVRALASSGLGRVIGTGGSTSVVFSGLPNDGTGYMFEVTGHNQFGTGTTATSFSPVTPTGNTSTYASVVQGDGPSLYFRFSEPNGNVSADSSGTGNYLTGGSIRGLSGALATDTDVAAYTGGCTCYMTSQSSAGLPTGNSARTVEAWVRNATGQPFSSWGGFGVDVSGMRTLRVTGGSQSQTFTADHDLLDNLWHHFVVTYDGPTVRGYVDGDLVGTASFAQSLATTATNLTVGWQGPAVDELAIYPTALTASQVAAHYYLAQSVLRSAGALS